MTGSSRCDAAAVPRGRISSRKIFRLIGQPAFLLLPALAMGIVLRLWSSGSTDLWEDEILATTHAVQPWWAVVVDTLRYDIHPPLYFLQLHFWSLLGHADRWFMANSMLWSMAGLYCLWRVTKQHWGEATALAATAFYAVSPAAVYMADQVRMYAMLAAFAILSLHLTLLTFQEGDRRMRLRLSLMGLNFAIILTHALGAFLVGLNALFALRACRKDRSMLRWWLLCYSSSALLAVPWIVNALMHDGNVVGLWNLKAILLACAGSVAGLLAWQNPLLLGGGLAIFLVAALMGLRHRDSRPLLLHFVLLPLAVAVITGLFLQPFLKWNFFATLTAPYLAITLGMLFQHRARIIALSAAACLAALLAISVWQKATFRENSHFREVAGFVARRYLPGDLILVPQYGYFRGLAWYLHGPGWDALAVAPPPSGAWRRVLAELGPGLATRLKLVPRSQVLVGKPFVLAAALPAGALHPARIWLVTSPRADLPAGFPPAMLGGLARQGERREGLSISLYGLPKARPGL